MYDANQCNLSVWSYVLGVCAFVCMSITASYQCLQLLVFLVFSGEYQLDILINNAGIMFAPYNITVDGFEQTIASNYLGTSLCLFAVFILHRLNLSTSSLYY